MNQDGQKKLFWVGTLFLFLAMIVITILPNFVIQNLPFLYIKIKTYISLALMFFIVTFIFYTSSINTYKKQLIAIICAFIYFYIFINFLAG